MQDTFRHAPRHKSSPTLTIQITTPNTAAVCRYIHKPNQPPVKPKPQLLIGIGLPSGGGGIGGRGGRWVGFSAVVESEMHVHAVCGQWFWSLFEHTPRAFRLVGGAEGWPPSLNKSRQLYSSHIVLFTGFASWNLYLNVFGGKWRVMNGIHCVDWDRNLRQWWM